MSRTPRLDELEQALAALDRGEKMLVYGANGVGHLWLVDPVARAVEAHRNERGRWEHLATLTADAPLRLEPFAAIDLPLDWLWAR